MKKESKPAGIRPYFPFFATWVEQISEFEEDPDIRLRLYDAIANYGAYGINIINEKDNKIVRVVFQGMLPALENSRKKYENGSKPKRKAGRNHKIDPPTEEELLDYIVELKGLEDKSQITELHRYQAMYFLNWYEAREWTTDNYKINNWVDAFMDFDFTNVQLQSKSKTKAKPKRT